MAQVRLVQLGATQVSVGGLLQTLSGQALNVQMGTGLNTGLSPYYRDASNPATTLSAPVKASYVQSRTLGYITGTGASSIPAVAGQIAIPTTGTLFSIWNKGNIQQTATLYITTPSQVQAKYTASTPATYNTSYAVAGYYSITNHPANPQTSYVVNNPYQTYGYGYNIIPANYATQPATPTTYVKAQGKYNVLAYNPGNFVPGAFVAGNNGSSQYNNYFGGTSYNPGQPSYYNSPYTNPPVAYYYQVGPNYSAQPHPATYQLQQPQTYGYNYNTFQGINYSYAYNALSYNTAYTYGTNYNTSYAVATYNPAVFTPAQGSTFAGTITATGATAPAGGVTGGTGGAIVVNKIGQFTLFQGQFTAQGVPAVQVQQGQFAIQGATTTPASAANTVN